MISVEGHREKRSKRSNSFDSTRLSSSNYEPRDEEPCDRGAKKGWIAYAFVICGLYGGQQREERERERERDEGRSQEVSCRLARQRGAERWRINRYRDTASRRKPTSQQLSKGPVLLGCREKTAGMHQEQVARLPAFRNLQRPRHRGTCPIVRGRNCPALPDEMSEKIAARPLVLSTFSQRSEII